MRISKYRSVALDRNENLTGYLFIAPSFILFLFFSIIPLVLSAVLSFTDWDMISGFGNIKFTGIQNYKDLLTDIDFIASFKNNIIFGAITIPLQLVGGLLIAVLINKHCYARNIFKAIYFLPYISSTVAIATVFAFLLHPSFGPVNEFLKSVGIQNPPKWLVDQHWALPSLALMYVWQNIGYDIIIFLAALQTVPQELYESADIDGASWLNRLRSITIPLITPTTFFLLIAEVMGSFRVFDQIQVLTEGGPGNATSVLVYYLYRVSFRYYKIGYGSAIATVLFIIIFIITYLQWKGKDKWVNYI
jgi:multiple sugar transport system permease protein